MKLRIKINADIVVDEDCPIFENISGNKITPFEWARLPEQKQDEYTLLESDALGYAADIIELDADWDFTK